MGIKEVILNNNRFIFYDNDANGVNDVNNVNLFKINNHTIQRYLDGLYNISSQYPTPSMWLTMFGITMPVLCYAGYKIWKWVNDITTPSKQDLYEYKYLDELDELMETKLDDIKNPEHAELDTIKIGKYIFPLDAFRSFSKNYRKRLIRKSDKQPIVKRVPIPSAVFQWATSFTEDVLPNQNLIAMRYEPDTESFWWYSNSSTVPYKYLETVARKYVCEFNRLDVFIDIRDELKKGAEQTKKRLEGGENKEGTINGDGDVDGDGNSNDRSLNEKRIYAKFRKYNKKSARVDPSISNKRIIIKARANRYSYKGKIEDYNKLFSHNEHENDNENDNGNDTDVSIDTVKVENISWSDWKHENY